MSDSASAVLSRHGADRVDEAFLRGVIEHADLNALRLALYQQTRDPALTEVEVVEYLRDGSPFRTLIIPEAQRQLVKDKAVAYLLAHAGDALRVPSRPDADAMMQMFAGQPLSQTHLDYGWEDLAFETFPRGAEWRVKPAPEVLDNYKVTIIGAGFSGILAAIQLDRLGIEYRIIERQAGVGGTWFLNDYPEARVDVTSFLYQFKFEKAYPWKNYYATQGELLEYFEYLLDKYDLRRRITVDTRLTSARWDEASKTWNLKFEGPDGKVDAVRSAFVISAAGLFSTPALPNIPGIGNFQGEMFHTTAWNHTYDYAGKRVAIIGNGSTGSQLARAVADKAASLTIYQRSAKWLSRVGNYRQAVSDEKRWLLDNMPGYVNWFCYGLHVAALQMDAFHDLDRDWQAKGGKVNEKNDQLRASLERFIRRKVGDGPLADKLIPRYAPLSRRLVVDNGWYDTLLRANVELVCGKVDRFTQQGVVSDDGVEREFDLVVLAAGFEVEKYLWPVDYIGREGARLEDLWEKDGARAHMTLTLPGFPNFIIMYGPNAGILSGSFHSWIEIYTRYVCRLITETIEHGAGSIEVKRSTYDDYNRALDAKMTTKLWQENRDASGYYINAHGRPGVSMPWSLEEFYPMILEPDLDEYILS